MQAMIFAAGLGTRLKPLTDHMPKALVRVGGEPLLRRVIFKLKAAGVTRIIINVHHFSDMIVDYLKENDNFGMDIRISDETAELLETGGGILHARKLFSPLTPILIHNVDILSNVDLKKFYHLNPRIMCQECGVPHIQADATLLMSWRKTKRYLVFNNDMLLVGWVNIETGEVKSPFEEVKTEIAENVESLKAQLSAIHTSTPTNSLLSTLHYQLYAFSGIHTFSPRLFSLMESYPEKFPIMDFYLQNCDKAVIRGYVKNDLRLMDVGKQDTLKQAEDFLNTL